MTVERRLQDGGLIDRSKPLEFQFNGKSYRGFEGDTLSSALMANGVDVISRSFKYHRPRGIQHIGSADVSSLVQMQGEDECPNVLASTVSLHNRMRANSVNCWPSVNFDLSSALGLLSPIIPAGFYYKTFMWPHWHLFEPSIRKLAGFGRAPKEPSKKQFQNRYWHCDVLIVGAGASGLMAAQTVARSGARVVIVDERPVAGGNVLFSTSEIGGYSASQWVSNTVKWLKKQENVLFLNNSTAWNYLEGNMVCVLERSPQFPQAGMRNWKIWAKQVVLATGSIERAIAFENNDAPGVMYSDAIRSMIQTHAVIPGRQAVMFVNNDKSYSTLEYLANAGIHIQAVVDVRCDVSEKVVDYAKQFVSEIIAGSVVRKAMVRQKRICGVSVTSRKENNKSKIINCDLLAVSGGWNPVVHLFSQSRGTLNFDDSIGAFVPGQPQLATLVTGSAKGIFSLDRLLSDGMMVGVEAAESAGFRVSPETIPQISGTLQAQMNVEPFWCANSGKKRSKTFVDLAGDVTMFDLCLAYREGYSEIEHLKRYTTTGMGLDQGKTANMSAIGFVSELTGEHPSQVGTTTYRPPYTPVEFGAIAGSRTGNEVLPYRHTPMTPWHVAHNAVMHEAGLRWRRPAYYSHAGESMNDAIRRECISVRNKVGIYDGSPLGKFELTGPDVIEFLNLIYTNRFDTLKIGRGKYGIMLSEDGLIFDDGVTFKLGECHYLMSCSTGGANLVEQKLLRLINVDQPELDVIVTPCTSQWANATVCGPLAREMLLASDSDIDFSKESFPFMHLRKGTIASIPTRIMRVSFTGELSFEINVPSRFGKQLWEYLIELGEKFEICPVGSEANHVLRVEKGFLSLAHEVDGTVDPIDLGMKRLVDFSKSDFVGKRAVQIRRADCSERNELVGLLPEDPNQLIEEGAPIAPKKNPDESDGFVSACVWSDVCDRTIALGILKNGTKRDSEVVAAWFEGKFVRARVTKPVFYDPDGKKLRM